MTLPLARTSAEAHVYMELQPCPACGEREFTPPSAVIEAEGDLASRYAGPCPRCDTRREFVFRLPQEVILPDEDNPTFGDADPSELLDPGQWLWLADVFSSGVPAHPTDDLTAPDRRQIRHDLLTAAAAIDEVLKFLPSGGDAVPRTALWSETGHRVYEKEPGRFHRRRLEVVRRTYRDIAERFAG